MAPRVTSSRDRGKGKAQKPVTTSKGRANRQKAASGRPITQRGRQERGGARVTQGRGAAPTPPTQAPALPPGRKGGPLARRTPKGQPRLPGGTGNQPRLPGGTGNQPRLPGGTGNQPRLPGGTGGQLRLPPGSAKVLGRGGGLLGPIGAAFALGTQIGEMMEPSRGQQAINRRISQDAAREAEEKANPTRGGLTGDQRLRNARAEQGRRKVRERKAATAQPDARHRPPKGEQAPQPSGGGGGGGGARVPQTGGGGRPSAMPAAVTRAQTSQPAGQSKNMAENYATWTRANRKLAERVKPGQAGYSTIQKTLAEMKGSQPTSTPGPRPKTQQEVAENLARAGRHRPPKGEQASGEGGEGGFRANAPNLMPGMKPGIMGSPKDFEGGEGMDFGAQLPDSAMPQWLKNLKKKYK